MKNFNKYNKKYLEQINQQNLEEISGGKTSKNYKVMAGLMACLIVLSPIMEVNSAGFENETGLVISKKIQDKTFIQNEDKLHHGSIDQDTLVEPCQQHLSKEELLAMLPDLWKKLRVANDANSVSKNSTIDFIYTIISIITDVCLISSVYPILIVFLVLSMFSVYHPIVASVGILFIAAKGVIKVMDHTARVSAIDSTIEDTWRPGGTAYEIVKDYSLASLQDLVKVLQEQIAILENLANQNRH